LRIKQKKRLWSPRTRKNVRLWWSRSPADPIRGIPWKSEGWSWAVGRQGNRKGVSVWLTVDEGMGKMRRKRCQGAREKNGDLESNPLQKKEVKGYTKKRVRPKIP